MHQHNQLELFCEKPKGNSPICIYFAPWSNVMVIGRRRTCEGAAYHSTIRKEHVEKECPSTSKGLCSGRPRMKSGN